MGMLSAVESSPGDPAGGFMRSQKEKAFSR